MSIVHRLEETTDSLKGHYTGEFDAPGSNRSLLILLTHR